MTQQVERSRNQEATARLHASFARARPRSRLQPPWAGGEWAGVYPINTGVERSHPSVVKEGVHVLDLFSGITCAGLRVVLATGLKVKCYTAVEIDEVSRGIANEVLSKLQHEYTHELPDSALRGQSKRLPHDVKLIGKEDLKFLMQNKGEIHFVCGGWQCQSVSHVGPQTGMTDVRFDPFFNMVKIINILKRLPATRRLSLGESCAKRSSMRR